MPAYKHGSVPESINEIVNLVSYTLKRKELSFNLDLSSITKLFPVLLFDERRLQ